jgi:FixJ family two-component response regulator
MTTTHGNVFVVDDDHAVRHGVGRLLASAGFQVKTYESAGEFLADRCRPSPSCLIVDQHMPGRSGLELQRQLPPSATLPIIFLTGHADVSLSVTAMKGGAFDFLTKPVDEEPLIEAVHRALESSARSMAARAERDAFLERLTRLTPRERDVCELVVRGRLNKQVAGELGIAERTVKVHRANMLKKLEVGSLAELARLVERTHAFATD